MIFNFEKKLNKLNKMEEAMKKRWIYNHNIMEAIAKAKRILIKNYSIETKEKNGSE